jgi:anti-anti-sigma factor
MEIVRTQHEQWLEVSISGRLNARWVDSLERELSGAVRDGARRIYLDMSGITFMSSAGIRILLKYRKELASLQGCVLILSPSEIVANVLQLSGLLELFVAEKPADEHQLQQKAAGGCVGEVLIQGGSISLERNAADVVMSLRTVGDPGLLDQGAFHESYRISLPDNAVAVGLGGFGDGFAECREQFGEFMSLGGCTISLPTDDGDTPDFLAQAGEFIPSVQALYALVCQGNFAGFFTFNSDSADDPLPFSRLAATALSICATDCIALAMIAETDGLVGASLLRSPALSDGVPLLAFPGVRDRLALTSEPRWPRSLALVCGIALQREEPRLAPFVRPLGEGALNGHFHAAALSYRALPNGVLELAPMVCGLMQTQNLLGLSHLVNDTRPISGIGESRFLRGAVWCGPAELGEAAP